MTKPISPFVRPTLGAQIHGNDFRAILDGHDCVVRLDGETTDVLRAQKALAGTPHGVQVFVAREQITVL